jgi:dUTP pyrophosphatase
LRRISQLPRKFYEVDKKHRVNKKVVNVEQMGVQEFYPEITLPTRGTRNSAGYDFYCPIDITLLPAQKTIIWSDVKVELEEGEYLAMHVRSSLGIKQGIILSNITGIVDKDYFSNPNNDGNIGLALLNTSGVGVEIKRGDRICQGIISKYYVTDDDAPLSELRTGGTGSSGK